MTILGETRESCEQVSARLGAGILPLPKKEGTKLPVGFWRQSGQGPKRTRKMIEATHWGQIEGNYPVKVRKTLAELTGMTPEYLDGQILLLYGPAGTGKTTFLRALLRAWDEWMSMEYISDPERLLNDGDYLISVLLNDGDQYPGNLLSSQYRLLILEDAGELITADSRKTTGQGLSRLLNMTDGMLGEGANLLVAITTNEDISALHPAIIRPGRCLAKAEMDKFTPDEARDWLGADAGSEPLTLAELYHMRRGLGRSARSTPAKKEPGLYL